jgi:hypothetical protein
MFGLLKLFYVGFEVLTAVSTKMAVLWVVALCSLIEVYQRFKSPCCLHHQGVMTHRRDDGGSKNHWNVGKLLPDYTALQPRRQPYSTMNAYGFYKIKYIEISEVEPLSDTVSRWDQSKFCLIGFLSPWEFQSDFWNILSELTINNIILRYIDVCVNYAVSVNSYWVNF